MGMEFIVDSLTEGGTKATTIIEANPVGFRIEITGGRQPEIYTSKAAFSMEVLSDAGIKAFFDKYSPGLYSPWFHEAADIVKRLK